MTIAPHRLQIVLGAVLVFAVAGMAIIVLAHRDTFRSSSGSSVEGSGVPATQVRDVAGFRGVELAGSNDVVVRVGGTQSVVVHADDNLLGHVTTQVRDGNLVIGTTPGSYRTKVPMSVVVTVPSLDAVTLAGSGLIRATGVDASSVTVTLSGSGLVRMSGTATRLAVSLGGSGDAQLEQLVAKDVQAVVEGSGRIVVTATDSLDASVPGSGAIVYGGNPPHVTTSITGSGAVTRA